MKLFLASEAKNPETIQKLKSYVNGFQGKSIAYIPTAANGTKWSSWKQGGSWNLIQTLEAKITLVQLEDYGSKTVINALTNKDIIWVAGGYCGYLMYWIRRCELDKAFPKLLEKSVYVGSSAGSMIAGKSLDVTEWYMGDNEAGASVIPTLHLVNFDIFPHYEDHLLPTIKKLHKTKTSLYLLKNGEEIIVENEKIIIQGEKRIIK